MSKVFSYLMVLAMALSLGACANPWWDRNSGDDQPTATESQTGDTDTSATGQTPAQEAETSPGDVQAGQDTPMDDQSTNDQSTNEEFAQAIEKCQTMQGTEYQDCVDKARKDAGQM